MDRVSWRFASRSPRRSDRAAPGFSRPKGPNASERPAFPQLANAYFYESTQAKLAPATRLALDQAVSPQEWNLLLLSSPEFMLR
jgi:hypothetical protein